MAQGGAQVGRNSTAMAERDEHLKSTFVEKPEGLDLSALYRPGRAAEVQDRSYHILYPSVRKLVASSKQCQHLAKTGELMIRCAVCKEAKMARGWDPLLMHAKKYWKSYPNQHRGYYRALKQAFRAEKIWPEPVDPILWPPVLLVDDTDRGGIGFEGSLRRWRGLNGDEAVPRSLRDLQLQHVLAVYRKSNGDGSSEKSRGVLVFPASQIGRIDARRVNEVLTMGGSREDMNLRLSNGEILPRTSSGDSTDDEQRNSQAEPGPESDCEEDHHPLAIRTSVNQIRKMERAADVANKWRDSFRTQDCPVFIFKSNQLRKMAADFRRDLKSMGPKSALGGDEYQLQITEKQLRMEKLQWLKDIRQVKEQFETTEDVIRISEAQRELERRFEMIRKKNDRIAEESKLGVDELENHRKRLKDVEYKKMKQEMLEKRKRCEALVGQWEYEQEAFRRQAEIARHRKDILSSLCRDDEVGEVALQQIYERFKAEYDGISDVICSSPVEEVGVGDEDCQPETSAEAKRGTG